MKIAFEYWIEDNVKRQETKNILYEAVTCYKNSANRAALLLSYIAFVDIIKHRLIEAPKPSQVSEGDWNQSKKLILDDDECDKKVFELLNRTDNKYFKISDSIRNQIRYWKDRRNDCAHLKENKIESSHVESFWLFLSSNLNKVVVVGSGQDLINRVKIHFNEDYTPINTDYSYLINEIPKSVELTDLEDFLIEVESIIEKYIEETWLYGDNARFFEKMLNTFSGTYYDLVKKYILENDNLSKEMFRICPKFFIHYKHDNPQFIREMWKNHLNEIQIHKIACILLRNELIPGNEIKEFIGECVLKNHNTIPNEEDYNFLKLYGYDKELEEKLTLAITESNIMEWWIKENLLFIEFYIKISIRNRNLEFVDKMLKKFIECSSSGELDENTNEVLQVLSKVINNNNDLKLIIMERSEELSLDLGIFLFIF